MLTYISEKHNIQNRPTADMRLSISCWAVAYHVLCKRRSIGVRGMFKTILTKLHKSMNLHFFDDKADKIQLFCTKVPHKNGKLLYHPTQYCHHSHRGKSRGKSPIEISQDHISSQPWHERIAFLYERLSGARCHH